MEVVILAGAEKDLWSAWVRYEELAVGLGDKFDEAVRIGLNYVAQFPEAAPFTADTFASCS